MCERRGCNCDGKQRELAFDAPKALADIARTAERIAKPSEELRFVGVTDERTECERCGKIELRRTIVLRRYVDGAPEGVVYYGADCAAEALGRTKKRVLEDALRAERERRIDARRAEYDAHPAIVGVHREEERLEALGRWPSKQARERFAEARRRALADLGIIDPMEKR